MNGDTAMGEPFTEPPDTRIRRLDRWTGPVMFWVSLAFLTVFAGMLCSFSIEVSALSRFAPAAAAVGKAAAQPAPTSSPAADEPSAFGPAAAAEDWVPLEHAIRPLQRFGVLLGLLYVVILGEAIAQARARGYGWRRHLWYCLVPPLRIGGRDHVDGSKIWLPHLRWSRVDRVLQRRLERAFGLPMILVALAVLPLFLLDHHWQHKAVSPSWHVLVFLWASESLIWLAFAFEFIVMSSIAPKKLRYCREHWIDLVIIVAPIVGFLRLLRVARVLRLSNITRAARAYRLRGVSQRMFRGLLLVTLVRQLLEGNTVKRLAKLRDELRDRERDLEQLRAEIAALETRLAAEAIENSAVPDQCSCNSGGKLPI